MDAAGQPGRDQGGVRGTFGVRHDELPPDTNRLVTDLFFRLAEEQLAAGVSTVIEAAFQHKMWAYRKPRLVELADVRIVLCTADVETAARRSIRRGLEHPDREFYHGNHRVVHYKKTGEVLAPADYEKPRFDLPTISVSTERAHAPTLDEIVLRIRTEE